MAIDENYFYDRIEFETSNPSFEDFAKCFFVLSDKNRIYNEDEKKIASLVLTLASDEIKNFINVLLLVGGKLKKIESDRSIFSNLNPTEKEIFKIAQKNNFPKHLASKFILKHRADNWKINGIPIKNVQGAFVAYCKHIINDGAENASNS